MRVEDSQVDPGNLTGDRASIPVVDGAQRGKSARDRPIFVVGCPRSGTTLLQLMLHAHPRLAVPPENRYVLPAYYRRADWGDLGEAENRRALAKVITGRGTGFRDFGLDRKAVQERIVAAPPTLGSVLETVMVCFAEAHGATRWCDKRPMYVRHVQILRRLFPDAQFVHLVRDGRSAAASLARMTWFSGDLAQAIGTWRLAMEHARAARDALPADTWFDLSYEQLITEPEAQLRRLCSFLAEDFDPVMLEPGAVRDTLVPDRKTWHANAGGPLLAERTQSWREELSAGDITFLEAVAGRELCRAGYPVGAARRRADPVRAARFEFAYRRRRWWYQREQARDAAAVDAFPIASLYRSELQ